MKDNKGHLKRKTSKGRCLESTVDSTGAYLLGTFSYSDVPYKPTDVFNLPSSLLSTSHPACYMVWSIYDVNRDGDDVVP